MLGNYFKIMIRNLLKRKAFTLINLLGLSTGMAVCLLLALYIQNELGYDTLHEKGDQIYRLALERKYPGRSAFKGLIPLSIGQAVKQEFPEVLESVRIMNLGSSISIGDKNFEENKILAVDSNFFEVFTGIFLAGDGKAALQNPGSAVVNETTAKKLFGSVENAIGKSVVLDRSQNYNIASVCKDWPEKSHFQFNVLVSTINFSGLNELNYYDFYVHTYLLLNKNASATAMDAKLPSIVAKYVAPTIEKGFGETYEQFKAAGNGYRYFLQPLKKIHLYSELEDEFRPGGSIKTIYLFGAIAIFILLLACINFINLSTALSVERAREVGIRKTFGSGKSSIVWQFLAESILFCLISALAAVLLTTFFIPVLNKIAGTQLSFTYFLHPICMLSALGLTILTGIIAGLYPAFVLSSFKPIIVLKGRLKSGAHGMALRNGLVIFQFGISIILIICTIVVNSQMQYMLGDKLGFRKDHVITVEHAFRLENKRNAFVEEVSTLGSVEAISECNGLPDGKDFSTCAMQVVGTRVSRTQKTIYTDDRYLNLFDLQLKEGRFFSKDFATDSLSLVLNEKAVEDFGLKNPIGTRITSTEPFFNPRDGKAQNVYTVVGVIKDFHFESLHQKIAPLVIANSQRFGWGTVAIRLKDKDLKTSIGAIEQLWNRLSPKYSFQFNFLDQSLAEQYKAEQIAQKLFTIFSLLAILIACIGLLGLSTYTTLQRTKEISIRKVLGASTANIVTILSGSFLKLVVFSVLISFPIAWWAMHKWLQDFAYHINIPWWVFLLAGGIATLIAMVTISFQAIKAAFANPSKSLSAE